MYRSDSLQDTLYYHYSPTYKYAIGIEGVRDEFLDKDYAYFRFTYLLNRRNTKASQRNLYFQSGISSDGADNHFYGVHGDWESRRWFAGFGHRRTRTDARRYSDQYLQFGIAPYIGDYGDWHTWLMLKTKRETISDEHDTYPVIKFFKGDTLLELGYSDEFDWDIHLMHRF